MKKLVSYILLLSINLFSQNVILEVDTSFLRIGEQLNATLKIYDSQSDSLIFPQSKKVFNNLELINDPVLSSHVLGDTYLYKNFILTSFDTGQFVLDAVPVVFNGRDSIFSNTLSVNFIPFPLDSSNQFFDIKPPKEVPFLARELLFYIPHLLVFFVIILCGFLLFKYFSRKENLKPIITKPDIPIDIYFINKLDALIEKDYLNDKKYKAFYTELSEIFRGYLELRFCIPALESSTHDLKLSLSNLKIKNTWINSFLRVSDIVKFAKGVPSHEESLSFLKDVRSFILEFGQLNDVGDQDHESVSLKKK